VLLGLHQDPDLRASLEHSGVRRFAPVEESAYEGIPALGIPDAARDLSPAD